MISNLTTKSCIFFFSSRRRHTRFKCDWSSDVCSSDLVGGGTLIRVDVRVVAATNQPLEQRLQAGTFRRDLFFRLQVVEIRVPPLRERPTDILLLAEHFLRRFVRETGRKIRDFTPTAKKKMEDYHWPGNVRELRNV